MAVFFAVLFPDAQYAMPLLQAPRSAKWHKEYTPEHRSARWRGDVRKAELKEHRSAHGEDDKSTPEHRSALWHGDVLGGSVQPRSVYNEQKDQLGLVTASSRASKSNSCSGGVVATRVSLSPSSPIEVIDLSLSDSDDDDGGNIDANTTNTTSGGHCHAPSPTLTAVLQKSRESPEQQQQHGSYVKFGICGERGSLRKRSAPTITQDDDIDIDGDGIDGDGDSDDAPNIFTPRTKKKKKSTPSNNTTNAKAGARRITNSVGHVGYKFQKEFQEVRFPSIALESKTQRMLQSDISSEHLMKLEKPPWLSIWMSIIGKPGGDPTFGPITATKSMLGYFGYFINNGGKKPKYCASLCPLGDETKNGSVIERRSVLGYVHFGHNTGQQYKLRLTLTCGGNLTSRGYYGKTGRKPDRKQIGVVETHHVSSTSVSMYARAFRVI